MHILACCPLQEGWQGQDRPCSTGDRPGRAGSRGERGEGARRATRVRQRGGKMMVLDDSSPLNIFKRLNWIPQWDYHGIIMVYHGLSWFMMVNPQLILSMGKPWEKHRKPYVNGLVEGRILKETIDFPMKHDGFHR